MKKVIVVFIVVLVFGACSAQRVAVQSSNIEQKIIGTWVGSDGSTWVFNANGTIKKQSKYGNTVERKYGITETQLAFEEIEYGNNTYYFAIYDISISSDGKTLILTSHILENTRGYWLTKK